MSMCRVFSCVVGRGCLLWPVCSLGKSLVSLCPASFCTPRPNLPVSPGISWLYPFVFWSPIMKRTSFWVLVLEGLIGLHGTIELHFLQHSGWGIDLDYYDTEWFALEMKRDHSVFFEIASQNCISNSFVDYDDYSISSKEFLPTVVDIMVIWIKFPQFWSILVHWFLKCWCSFLPSPVWPLPICLDSWT